MGRVLLLRYRAERADDPSVTGVGAFWITPGGGLEDSESPAEGASRELREETGIERSAVMLGGHVAERKGDLWISGVLTHCHEWFFVVRSESETISRSDWTQSERSCITEVRWFEPEALRASGRWDDELGPRGAGWFFARCAAGDVPGGVTWLEG